MYTRPLFDLDGTLTDSRFGIVESVRHALGQAGYEIPPHDTLNWFVGPPLRESFLKLAQNLRMLVHDLSSIRHQRSFLSFAHSDALQFHCDHAWQ